MITGGSERQGKRTRQRKGSGKRERKGEGRRRRQLGWGSWREQQKGKGGR